MWTPDVYEGAPTPVTALFAVAPKIAAMSLLVSVLMGPFKPLFAQWQQIIVVASVLSMALGAFAALAPAEHQAPDGLFLDRQRRLRAARPGRRQREGHPGGGLLPGDLPGHDARRLRHHPADEAPRRHGREHRRSRRPGAQPADDGLRLLLFMFSLAGIPPLAGFLGKLYIFMAAVEAKLYVARRAGRAGLGRGVLLLPAHRQGDVLRRAGRGARPAGRSASTASWPSSPPSCVAVFSLAPQPLSVVAAAAAKGLFP